MFIIVQHSISNSAEFFEAAKGGMAELPGHLALHQILPSIDASKASCLWEAPSIRDVREFLEPAVGRFSKNSYYTVDIESAAGLPPAIKR